MGKKVPHLLSAMTPFPYHIDGHASINDATAMMEEHGINHLPVTDGDDIVSIISDRDIKRITTPGKHINPDVELSVADICPVKAYLADVNDPVDRVLAAMIERHIDAVAVMKEDRLVGVFTSSDACKLLFDILQDFRPKGGGNEAA